MDSKDYFKQMNEELDKRKKWPWYVLFTVELYEFLRYRLINTIKDLPDTIKWEFQSFAKGYSDPDIWNLNYFIVNKVRQPLKDFVRYQEEHGHSLPMDFAEHPAEWLVVLAKMEYAFDSVWKEENDVEYWDNVLTPMTSEQRKEHYEKITEGMGLFGKYMLDLWD